MLVYNKIVYTNSDNIHVMKYFDIEIGDITKKLTTIIINNIIIIIDSGNNNFCINIILTLINLY